MSAKVLPALVVGLLLGMTALASAQTYQRGLYTPVVERGIPPYWADPITARRTITSTRIRPTVDPTPTPAQCMTVSRHPDS